MFEFEEKIVETLLRENTGFKRLYDKHSDLKVDIDKANAGKSGIEDLELEKMKKEKLLLKDQMARIIADYKKEHAL